MKGFLRAFAVVVFATNCGSGYFNVDGICSPISPNGFDSLISLFLHF